MTDDESEWAENFALPPKRTDPLETQLREVFPCRAPNHCVSAPGHDKCSHCEFCLRVAPLIREREAGLRRECSMLIESAFNSDARAEVLQGQLAERDKEIARLRARLAKIEELLNSQVKEIEADERFYYWSADVRVNAPLALIQVDMGSRYGLAKSVLAILHPAAPDPVGTISTHGHGVIKRRPAAEELPIYKHKHYGLCFEHGVGACDCLQGEPTDGD